MSAEDAIDGVDRDVLVAWLLRIAAEYRWTGWQGLDEIRPGTEGRALVGTFEQAMRDPEAELFVEPHGGTPLAAAIRKHKPMETELLGRSTAELSHVICDPDTPDRPEVVGRLLSRIVADSKRDGTELLVLRVNSADVETLAAAQLLGFSVVETTVTYLADAQANLAAPELPDGVTVEVHEGTTGGALSGAEVEKLTAETAGWRLSRFRADPNLDDRAVDRYYSAWIPNIASGQFSDCLYVARHRGELAGIYAENTSRPLLDLTGMTLRVGAWLAVVCNGRGIGHALMRVSAAHRFPGGRFHENETQAHNIATIRCLEHMRMLRSGYTLHAWPHQR